MGIIYEKFHGTQSTRNDALKAFSQVGVDIKLTGETVMCLELNKAQNPFNSTQLKFIEIIRPIHQFPRSKSVTSWQLPVA